MKELSIEQKAKAYDNIIEKANKMHSDNCEACQICIEELIPELKESEDERTRKALINVFATHKDYEKFFGVSVKDIRAWIERQGKHAIACSEQQMKVLNEVLDFAANHESPYWNDYIFETLNNFIRQLKLKV